MVDEDAYMAKREAVRGDRAEMGGPRRGGVRVFGQEFENVVVSLHYNRVLRLRRNASNSDSDSPTASATKRGGFVNGIQKIASATAQHFVAFRCAFSLHLHWINQPTCRR